MSKTTYLHHIKANIRVSKVAPIQYKQDRAKPSYITVLKRYKMKKKEIA